MKMKEGRRFERESLAGGGARRADRGGRRCAWYGYRQQILVGHLTAQQSMANATIGDMQGQVNALTSQLNEVPLRSKQLPAAEQAKAAAAHSPRSKGRGHQENHHGKQAPERTPGENRRPQKQLKDTQDEVARTARTWKGI